MLLYGSKEYHSQELVKVHCNLRRFDSIEEVDHIGGTIDWSSDNEENWLTDNKSAVELLRTFY